MMKRTKWTTYLFVDDAVDWNHAVHSASERDSAEREALTNSRDSQE